MIMDIENANTTIPIDVLMRTRLVRPRVYIDDDESADDADRSRARFEFPHLLFRLTQCDGEPEWP